MFEENSLLDNMLLDYQIFKLNNFWYNQEYIWERWVRL